MILTDNALKRLLLIGLKMNKLLVFLILFMLFFAGCAGEPIYKSSVNDPNFDRSAPYAEPKATSTNKKFYPEPGMIEDELYRHWGRGGNSSRHVTAENTYKSVWYVETLLGVMRGCPRRTIYKPILFSVHLCSYQKRHY